MSRHNTPIDEWRGCKAIDSTKPTEGLFMENAEEAHVETEVVSCSDANQLTTSGKDSLQPTTSMGESMQEKEENIDLNAINPDLEAILPFPIWGLPASLQEMTKQGAQVYGVPEEFFAISILQAVASALRKGVVTQGKYRNYAQLWVMIVAQSGIGKSEPMDIALKPLMELDEASFEDWQRAKDEWNRKNAKNQTKSKTKRQEIEPPPIYKQVIINDTTPEAMYQTLFNNPRGLLLFRDELKGWFEDMGRYNKSGELQNYLSLFDARTVSINRKSEDPKQIPAPYLSIMGSVQPNVLVKWLQNPSVVDNGFIPRFLFVMPDNVQKQMPTHKVMPSELLNSYSSFIDKVHTLGSTDPLGREILFAEEALRSLLEFECNLVELQNKTEVDYLKALYSKMFIHVNRLAIAVAVARHCAGDSEFEIDADTVRYSIELGEYFIATGEKVFRSISLDAPSQAISNQELVRLIAKRHPDWSQAKIAEVVGISQQAVSKVLK